jgi:hypothetical protein
MTVQEIVELAILCKGKHLSTRVAEYLIRTMIDIRHPVEREKEYIEKPILLGFGQVVTEILTSEDPSELPYLEMLIYLPLSSLPVSLFHAVFDLAGRAPWETWMGYPVRYAAPFLMRALARANISEFVSYYRYARKKPDSKLFFGNCGDVILVSLCKNQKELIEHSPKAPCDYWYRLRPPLTESLWEQVSKHLYNKEKTIVGRKPRVFATTIKNDRKLLSVVINCARVLVENDPYPDKHLYGVLCACLAPAAEYLAIFYTKGTEPSTNEKFVEPKGFLPMIEYEDQDLLSKMTHLHEELRAAAYVMSKVYTSIDIQDFEGNHMCDGLYFLRAVAKQYADAEGA